MADNLYSIRDVVVEDLDALIELENASFDSDRLSRRSFLRWIKGSQSILRVIEQSGLLVGYGLVLLHSGTRLARLYSVALDRSLRGQGLGRRLMVDLEACAVEQERFFMRLEVSRQNLGAIHLYKSLGYAVFDEIQDYYEDHTDALRMQKRIRFPDRALMQSRVQWYRQTTDFTCGPAALMMAMASLNDQCAFSQELELDLWREATTIYMTSGHGGCHPLGLALAAQRRGYVPTVSLSHDGPLFVEGVRSPHKKAILQTVHQQFLEQSRQVGIEIHYEPGSVSKIEQWLAAGLAVMVLISSYRLNGDKAPHWVVITACDELCFYVHDPDLEKLTRSELDCQHIPIAKYEFAKMTTYGSQRFSAALLIAL